MAGNEQKLEFLDFSVFRAGIASDDAQSALGNPHADIENQYAVFEEDNTYGCIAGTKSGLLAGPRVEVEMDYTMADASAIGTWVPDNTNPAGVLDTAIISPFAEFYGAAESAGGGISLNHKQQSIMMIGFGAFASNNNGTGYHGFRKMRLMDYGQLTSDIDFIGYYHGIDVGTAAAPVQPGGGNFVANFMDYYGWMNITPFRFLKNPLPDDKNKAGVPSFIATSLAMANPLGYGVCSVVQTLSLGTLPGWAVNNVPDAVCNVTASCIHQGRLVTAAGPNDFGAWVDEPLFLQPQGGRSLHNNNLHFTRRYNFTSSDWATGTVAGKTIVLPNESKWNTINALLSVNYNDLVILNANSGLTVVRGDIESAGSQIIHFPGVTPTFGATPKPVTTDAGVVYGSRVGAFLWNGGDKSVCISQQLRPDFMNTYMFDRHWHAMQTRGKLAYRYPYIFAPNEWVYDVRTESWWKIRKKQTSTLFSGYPDNPWIHYDVQYDGQVYATRAQVKVDAANPKFMARINPDAREYIYKARTHPISATISRRTRLREMVVRTRGHGSRDKMTVRIYADGGDLKKEFQVDCQLNKTINTLVNMDITGMDIQIEFEAEDLHVIAGAPDLLGFRMGYSTDSKYLAAV